MDNNNIPKKAYLRTGWTTGACATAATKAALLALITGKFPDPVCISLPKGQSPCFPLAKTLLKPNNVALAAIIKDAGDDPDVTHGAMIIAEVTYGKTGSGILFRAGKGVGTVTLPGLPIPPGEAAINPKPRQMMTSLVQEICDGYDIEADILITISVPEGEKIAQKTWNPRLGITGGISILGTTGIVHPFSCSAWIHSIHRGIDVARAAGQQHLIAATGSSSESAAQGLYHLPDYALLDMGDFAGAVLKYLRSYPVPKLTLSGGFAKFTKLAQGALDLHSSRSQVDKSFLWHLAHRMGLDLVHKHAILQANTALEILEIAQNNHINLAKAVSWHAQQTALKILGTTDIKIEVLVNNRDGVILAQTSFS